MENHEIGRVLVGATIENPGDLWDARHGRIVDESVRRIELENALVDTGATTLSLPTSVIAQLGLIKQSEKRVTTSAGPAVAAIYDAVRLTIQGRQCTVDVVEVPDGVPPLIGQIPVEMLDFVVDPRGQRLIGNPEHGGEHVIEMY
jgi:predicted aspartyl protease